MSIELINLPKIVDLRGNLTFVQSRDQVDFEIKRIFWTYDVPAGAKRGGYAYFDQQELIVALSGSFDVVVDDGFKKKNIFLNRSNMGLLLSPMVWRHMENFSTNSLGLHIVNSYFSTKDYIRDYMQFCKLVNPK